jgi:beta-glucosidase/6-phospho-beta-glucosidase/beta-galactosidase
MYDALHDVAEIGKSIYITENGLSDTYDVNRPDFIRDYLTEMYRAMQDGCDVRGYYHWTLMDNFEWHEGYGKKFGLYEVDFSHPDRTRTPRPSAYVYRDFFQLAQA